MGKIVYSYYTPADAPAVTELFRRNAFGMGKYDPELTPDRFIQNQEKRASFSASSDMTAKPPSPMSRATATAASAFAVRDSSSSVSC